MLFGGCVVDVLGVVRRGLKATCAWLPGRMEWQPRAFKTFRNRLWTAWNESRPVDAGGRHCRTISTSWSRIPKTVSTRSRCLVHSQYTIPEWQHRGQNSRHQWRASSWKNMKCWVFRRRPMKTARWEVIAHVVISFKSPSKQLHFSLGPPGLVCCVVSCHQAVIFIQCESGVFRRWIACYTS